MAGIRFIVLSIDTCKDQFTTMNVSISDVRLFITEGER